MTMLSQNPATGEVIQEYPFMHAETVEARVAGAQRAQRAWREVGISERAEVLLRVADALESDADRLAQIIREEMGKIQREAVAEIRKCALVCRHYARNTERYTRSLELKSDGSRAYRRYDPLGVVLAIMPWNFPFWQVFRFAAPTLMAGNAGLLKHAPNVSGCALAIEALFAQAGLPDGLFQALLVDVPAVETLIDDSRIAALTLTGSEGAGRAVAEMAGRALKPVVLELGGMDPFIVLASADLDRAAELGTASRCLNSGQSCIAAKRFIVVADVYDAFVERLRTRMGALQLGDPADPASDLGPLAQERFRVTLQKQVDQLVSDGARCVLGGNVPPGPGWFYPPTILLDVPSQSASGREEIFGPVALVYRVQDTEEALALANDSEFGLGASVWTQDEKEADAIVPRVEAGCVFVNGMVKSDPGLPFGGIKNSGIGRELGADGVLAFMNAKTVWVGR